jgi:serine/threonine protein kinase
MRSHKQDKQPKIIAIKNKTTHHANIPNIVASKLDENDKTIMAKNDNHFLSGKQLKTAEKIFRNNPKLSKIGGKDKVAIDPNSLLVWKNTPKNFKKKFHYTVGSFVTNLEDNSGAIPIVIYEGKKKNKLLGEGGMGKVKIGQLPDGTFCAVKVMTNTTDNINGIKNMTIVDPNNFYGMMVSNDKVYYAMPLLIGGKTLDKWIEEGGLEQYSFEEKMKWAAKFAQHLDQIHKKGYVHTDIKPSNLYLAPDEPNKIIKILDLDSILCLDPGTNAVKMDVAVGTTAQYLPGELFAHCTFQFQNKYNILYPNINWQTIPEIKKQYRNELCFMLYTQSAAIHAYGLSMAELFKLTVRGDIRARYPQLSSSQYDQNQFANRNYANLSYLPLTMEITYDNNIFPNKKTFDMVTACLQQATAYNPADRPTASELVQFFQNYQENPSPKSLRQKRKKMEAMRHVQSEGTLVSKTHKLSELTIETENYTEKKKKRHQSERSKNKVNINKTSFTVTQENTKAADNIDTDTIDRPSSQVLSLSSVSSSLFRPTLESSRTLATSTISTISSTAATATTTTTTTTLSTASTMSLMQPIDKSSEGQLSVKNEKSEKIKNHRRVTSDAIDTRKEHSEIQKRKKM